MKQECLREMSRDCSSSLEVVPGVILLTVTVSSLEPGNIFNMILICLSVVGFAYYIAGVQGRRKNISIGRTKV